MANPEHLAKLKEGVEAWNAWWKENHDVTPDLTDAHLNGATLSGATLSGADLSGADLTWADLFKAKGLDSDQLCSASSLVNAKLDDALATQAMTQCPEKFKEKEL